MLRRKRENACKFLELPNSKLACFKFDKFPMSDECITCRAAFSHMGQWGTNTVFVLESCNHYFKQIDKEWRHRRFCRPAPRPLGHWHWRWLRRFCSPRPSTLGRRFCRPAPWSLGRRRGRWRHASAAPPLDCSAVNVAAPSLGPSLF